MAKWAGIVAFREKKQDPLRPDVWIDTIVEKKYFGDIIKNSRRLDEGSAINDGIIINNSISILSDPYAREHFHKIMYLTYMGIKWKAVTVDVEYPRLIISLGGEYNGKQD